MEFLFKIKTKPISINSAYYRRNKSYNDATRDWRHNFLKQLNNDYNKDQITKFQSHFDSQKYGIRATFVWYTPYSKLFTKKSELSLASMDVDNLLKIPTDLLFDKKYNDVWLGKRRRNEKELYSDMTSLCNLSTNDKFIFDTRSIKVPSLDNDYHCSIKLELVLLSSLKSFKI